MSNPSTDLPVPTAVRVVGMDELNNYVAGLSAAFEKKNKGHWTTYEILRILERMQAAMFEASIVLTPREE